MAVSHRSKAIIVMLGVKNRFLFKSKVQKSLSVLWIKLKTDRKKKRKRNYYKRDKFCLLIDGVH